MENGSQFNLQLMRLPQGGFMVTDGSFPGEDQYRMRQFHFASTTIDEALKFMRDKMQPIPTTSNSAANTE